MFALAAKSFRNRRFTTILTIASIALSVTLLLGVERIRKEARTSFTNTISGTDLIVGARSGPVQLIVGEAAMLTVTGVIVGVCLLYALLLIGRPLILAHFGLFISIGGITIRELPLMALVCLSGLVIGVIPGYRIYRYSLADGMTIRM